jgi:hypothetical protein
MLSSATIESLEEHMMREAQKQGLGIADLIGNKRDQVL